VEELGPVPLRSFTTLRLGGPCRRMLVPDSEAELVEAVRDLDAAGEPVLLLGGGSNLVLADSGFAGTVVRLATRGISVVEAADQDRVVVRAAAGESWDALVEHAVADDCAGIEALSGIPGLVGATPVQNVGAYGQEVAETVVSVRTLDRETGEITEEAPAALGFGYRSSRLRGTDRWVVLAVTFALRRSTLARPVRYAELAQALGIEVGGQAPASDVRAAVLELRRSKGMVLDPDDHDTWSVGSFFTNPLLEADQAVRLPPGAPRFEQPDGRVKSSAAWLIDQAGFPRGYGHGDARISSKHTLALTNRGSSTTAEVIALAREIRDGVERAFGVTLEPEPRLVGVNL
jgi:UDP-N-acetylmuramate dehydrogenase